MAGSSVQRRQAVAPGSRLSIIPLLPPTLPLSVLLISASDKQAEKSMTNSSPNATPTATSMSVTLPGSVLSTVGPTASTTSGSTLPSIVPSFSWINLPSTINTCSSATLSWQYAGPQETLQFLLISNASPHTLATGFRKRAGNSTTLATNIDAAAAASWTWSKVNFTAGQYVVEAYGTGVDAASSTFTIVNGTDTSCLAAAVTSATSITITGTPLFPSPSFTPASTTSVPGRKASNLGMVTGGTVAGIVAFIVAFVAYRVWTQRRRRQPTGSRASSREVTRDSTPPRSVASHVQRLPLAERHVDGTHPLDSLSTNMLLEPNRRPPSSLLSAEPNTPVSPYAIAAQTRERAGASFTEVSTFGWRSSAAPSNAASTTSTTGLMDTFSSCPPSYTTCPSPPPSYTTDKTRSATSPSCERFSYASSS
ncbi:hypothetical protein GSI_10999 [Ganoderma sinense ZZ0214-1]|uniref:Uncharacterized protein n=1 Tax=Ganoderma sinense ZZ0214-1 TaxID=1077348 RepID=A0A2G8S257_9APHY|nr:hypothetical protein GSI_10999 [Ganoderma sinense ZZ0214-1]